MQAGNSRQIHTKHTHKGDTHKGDSSQFYLHTLCILIIPKGSYIVVLKCDQPQTLSVGKLGSMTTQPGYYVYTGRAMGPGGIEARLSHHRKISNKPHWYIDYLRAQTSFHEAWALASLEKKECEWATVFAACAEAGVPMKGFGLLDCHCATQLFYYTEYTAFADTIAGLIAGNPGLVEIASSGQPEAL